MFHGLSGLRSLDLSNCGIQHIDADTFDYWGEHLETLSLNSNKLSHIDARTFHGLKSLKFLHLESNPVTTIVDGAFEGLSNVLSMDISALQLSTISKVRKMDSLRLLLTCLQVTCLLV